MNNQTAAADQVFSLASRFASKVNSLGASGLSVQGAIDDGNHPFWVAVENFFKPIDPIQDWQNFYQKYFGITADFSGLKIPEKKAGFDRLIIVAEGLTLNQVYDACAKVFPCWRYSDDLDSAVPTNDRDPKSGTYAIWIRDRVEADEELKNLSADTLAEQKIKGITLLERMLFELKYFSETGGKHLDVQNWTLCNGSHRSDGNVPRAGWYSGRFRVDCSSSGYRHPHLRSREAVSL